MNVKLVRIIVIIILILVIYIFFRQLNNHKNIYADYKEVKAHLIDIKLYDGKNSMMNTLYFSVYSYEYLGENFIGERQVFTSNFKKMGRVESIKINPHAPWELEDTYKRNTSIFIIVFLALITFFLIMVIIKEFN